MIEASFNYLIQDKLYIWKRRKNIIKNDELRITDEDNKREKLKNSTRLGGNKLRDLAWSLDVLDLKK